MNRMIHRVSDGAARFRPLACELRVAAALLLLLGLSGCSLQRTVLDDSIVDVYGAAEDDLDFWDKVAERPVVTNDDALHGLLMLAEGEDPADAYPARLEEARRRGWLADDAEPQRNASTAMGMVSMAVCEILDVEGGLMMRLVGRTPRYCTRELVHTGVVPNRTENQSLTGLEFADLVRRVADRRQLAQSDEPPAAAAEP
jgi:hypothetical protein